MKIYTKNGDGGQTSGLDSIPVSKSDRRIAAIGSIDELNSWLGVINSHVEKGETYRLIAVVQRDLFSIGSYLSSADEKFLSKIDTQRLEGQIDTWSSLLPPLRNFILPGGSEIGAYVHIARSVARRAEREIVTVHEEKTIDERVLKYCNRLSDWLFTLARYINFQDGQVENIWDSDK